MSGFLIVAAHMFATTTSTFAQLCAGWTAVLPIAGMAIYGWFHGLFLAIIAGLQLLASFVLASACAPLLAGNLEAFGVPAGQSLAAAYALVFTASITAIRVAVGAWVPDGVVRFAPLFDRLGGACMGAVAGGILGGACLVAWSLAGVPDWMRFDAAHLPLDSGRGMLWTFARSATSDLAAADRLFAGDLPVAETDARGGIRASEPFVDTNGNDLYDAESVVDGTVTRAERYLDLDGDKAFSTTLWCADANGDGSRAIGLHDCYRLGAWRHVRCLHAPRITSDETVEIQENQPLEEPIYRATATDVDRNDVVTYHVTAVEGEGDLDVAIDPASGAVTLLQAADFERTKRHTFVVEARDKSGLSDQKIVSVRVRDVALE